MSGRLVLGLCASVTVVTGACAQPDASPSLADRGRIVYEDHCASCHGAGQGNPGLSFKPGTDALYAKYEGIDPPVPALLTERTDLSPAFLEYFVRNGVSIMPFFRKTVVSDADMQALSAYLVRAPSQ